MKTDVEIDPLLLAHIEELAAFTLSSSRDWHQAQRERWTRPRANLAAHIQMAIELWLSAHPPRKRRRPGPRLVAPLDQR